MSSRSRPTRPVRMQPSGKGNGQIYAAAAVAANAVRVNLEAAAAAAAFQCSRLPTIRARSLAKRGTKEGDERESAERNRQEGASRWFLVSHIPA